MSSEIVFITGSTGHVGFKTLLETLKAGYSVKAAIRSESKKDQILSAPSIKALNPGSKLTFVVVPDLTAEGAYDEAIKGSTYVLHIASPIILKGEIRLENYERDLINPARTGTVGILKAAAKATGIKRVVITSSVVAIVQSKYILDEDTPEGTIWDHNSRTPFEAGPYRSDFDAYNASKVAALIATETFVRDFKPKFDIVNINPGFVLGKNELITTAKDALLGTNIAALAPILGNKSTQGNTASSVHLDDVAFVHVKALDPKIPAGTYLTVADGYAGTVWQNATRIVAENYPKAVAKGILKNDGVQPTLRARFDASHTEKVFGFKFQGLEEQVKSVVSHYLELLGEKAE